MGLCFSLKTAWVPLYFLFHAVLILTISPVNSNTETRASYIIFWTSSRPMKIGIPIRTFSDRFVRIETSINNPDEKTYTGFSIDLFVEVVKTLSFDILPYEFVEFDGSYDDLLTCVANQTFDAAVGDITITADRSRVVDFTLPYTEQGHLWLMVSMKPQPPNLCLFLKPFTMQLWFAIWTHMMCTMFMVWLFEHRSNPEFHGQLGNVLWFTFSSLFFAHKERIQSNYSRVVVVVWLIVEVILIQSYITSLASMLTVTRLDPNVDSSGPSKFDFKELYNSREDIATESHYLDAFKSGKISAAFLEVPYAKAIDSHYCNQLAVTEPIHEFGGFGFVFQKGSPIVDNISTAILNLMQDGTLKKLEDEYFTPSSDCSNFQTAKNNRGLSVQHFRGLSVFYLAISTICILLFVQKHRREVLQEGNITPMLGKNNIADSRYPGRAPISGHAPNYLEMH
ncbi:glutamate receptor 2.8-like [Cornus florida]|uniref:glutamate receptor 2.8-like n=1 Tax=Cornus florida TaxID=4283 RepID=UPI00289C8407|nr:glutamate receptor 2.8-like [Cornus florida]